MDGLCFTPFNKQALHMAGMQTEDETQWAKAHTGHTGRASEFNVIDGMWNARVTSHVPLKDVAGLRHPVSGSGCSPRTTSAGRPVVRD